MNFNLVFRPMGDFQPARPFDEVLVYSQCDGFHLYQPRYEWKDDGTRGECYGIAQWASGDVLSLEDAAEIFCAWADLPDSLAPSGLRDTFRRRSDAK